MSAWTKITGHPSDSIRPVRSSLISTVAPSFGLSITKPGRRTPATLAGSLGAATASLLPTACACFGFSLIRLGLRTTVLPAGGLGPLFVCTVCSLGAGLSSRADLKSIIVMAISEAAVTKTAERTRMAFFRRSEGREGSESGFGFDERIPARTPGDVASWVAPPFETVATTAVRSVGTADGVVVPPFGSASVTGAVALTVGAEGLGDAFLGLSRFRSASGSVVGRLIPVVGVGRHQFFDHLDQSWR